VGILGLGTLPIPGADPAGRDVRLGEDFLQVQGEIDRLNSLSLLEEGGIKWPVVARLSEKILREDSKDILVAAYLGVSLLETEGVASLGPVAGMLAGLINNFWDSLFPPLRRLRARVNAVDWWRERSASWLRKYDGEGLDEGSAREAEASLGALDKALQERNLPRAKDLLKLLSVIPRKAASPPPAPGTAPEAGPQEAAKGPPPEARAAPVPQAAAAPARPAPPSAPVGPAPPGGPDGAGPESLTGALSALRRGATGCLGFLGESYADPRYWVISRLRLWIGVGSLPPAEGGRTRIPPPDKDILPGIRDLLRKGSYEAALRAAEDRVPESIFWLDPQRLAWSALKGLGHLGSANALRRSCQSFMGFLPGIASLGFEDGTPFASPETAAWLSDEGGGAGPAPRGGPDYEALAQGDPGEAMARLGLPENLPRDGRGRLEKGICEARLWQALGRPRTAAGVADGLEALLERHALAEFDPALAARALKAAYGAYLALGAPFAGKARGTLDRLAGLSPSEALGLPGPGDE
jgi:type VI secretion system protein VasJ